MSSDELVACVSITAGVYGAIISHISYSRGARKEREKIFDELMDMTEPDLKRFQDALKAYDRIKKYERGERRLDGGLK